MSVSRSLYVDGVLLDPTFEKRTSLWCIGPLEPICYNLASTF